MEDINYKNIAKTFIYLMLIDYARSMENIVNDKNEKYKLEIIVIRFSLVCRFEKLPISMITSIAKDRVTDYTIDTDLLEKAIKNKMGVFDG